MPDNSQFAIIGLTLYIAPFYAGDHIHEAKINQITKDDLIDRGIKEFDSYDTVSYYFYGIWESI